MPIVPIIKRVHELAENHGTSMAGIALAWLLTKVDAPIAGATKPERVTRTAEALNIELSSKDIAYLEEPYTPHRLVGVMEQVQQGLREQMAAL